MTVVTETIDVPDGVEPELIYVDFVMVGVFGVPLTEFVVDGTTYVGKQQVTGIVVNPGGGSISYSIDLPSNVDPTMVPAGAVWQRIIRSSYFPSSEFNINVPVSGGPYDIMALATDLPGALADSALGAHAAGRGPASHLPDGPVNDGDIPIYDVGTGTVVWGPQSGGGGGGGLASVTHTDSATIDFSGLGTAGTPLTAIVKPASIGPPELSFTAATQAALDAEIARATAAEALKVNIASVLATVGTSLVGSRVTGDTFDRFSVQADGVHLFGTGAIAADTNLYRSAANRLATDDEFEARAAQGGSVRIGAVGPSLTAGAIFGLSGDTNLYRSAADTLKTDDSLVVSGASGITVNGAGAGAGVTTANAIIGANFGGANGAYLGATASGVLGAGVAFGSSLDTNLYRSAANVLKTDDAFIGVSLSPSGLTGATAASRYVGATTSGPPVSGTFAVGDYVITQDGGIQICTAAGTPGTWTAVTGGGGGSQTPWTSTIDGDNNNLVDVGGIVIGASSIAGQSGVQIARTLTGQTATRYGFYNSDDITWSTGGFVTYNGLIVNPILRVASGQTLLQASLFTSVAQLHGPGAITNVVAFNASISMNAGITADAVKGLTFAVSNSGATEAVGIDMTGTITASTVYAMKIADYQSYHQGRMTLGGNTAPTYALDIKGTAQDRGVIAFAESAATPTNPTSSAQALMYMKADKLVIAYNDAGTMRYKYLDLTGTGFAWAYSATAP